MSESDSHVSSVPYTEGTNDGSVGQGVDDRYDRRGGGRIKSGLSAYDGKAWNSYLMTTTVDGYLRHTDGVPARQLRDEVFGIRDKTNNDRMNRRKSVMPRPVLAVVEVVQPLERKSRVSRSKAKRMASSRVYELANFNDAPLESMHHRSSVAESIGVSMNAMDFNLSSTRTKGVVTANMFGIRYVHNDSTYISGVEDLVAVARFDPKYVILNTAAIIKDRTPNAVKNIAKRNGDMRCDDGGNSKNVRLGDRKKLFHGAVEFPSHADRYVYAYRLAVASGGFSDVVGKHAGLVSIRNRWYPNEDELRGWKPEHLQLAAALWKGGHTEQFDTFRKSGWSVSEASERLLVRLGAHGDALLFPTKFDYDVYAAGDAQVRRTLVAIDNKRLRYVKWLKGDTVEEGGLPYSEAGVLAVGANLRHRAAARNFMSWPRSSEVPMSTLTPDVWSNYILASKLPKLLQGAGVTELWQSVSESRRGDLWSVMNADCRYLIYLEFGDNRAFYDGRAGVVVSILAGRVGATVEDAIPQGGDLVDMLMFLRVRLQQSVFVPSVALMDNKAASELLKLTESADGSDSVLMDLVSSSDGAMALSSLTNSELRLIGESVEAKWSVDVRNSARPVLMDIGAISKKMLREVKASGIASGAKAGLLYGLPVDARTQSSSMLTASGGAARAPNDVPVSGTLIGASAGVAPGTMDVAGLVKMLDDMGGHVPTPKRAQRDRSDEQGMLSGPHPGVGSLLTPLDAELFQNESDGVWRTRDEIETMRVLRGEPALTWPGVGEGHVVTGVGLAQPGGPVVPRSDVMVSTGEAPTSGGLGDALKGKLRDVPTTAGGRFRPVVDLGSIVDMMPFRKNLETMDQNSRFTKQLTEYVLPIARENLEAARETDLVYVVGRAMSDVPRTGAVTETRAVMLRPGAHVAYEERAAALPSSRQVETTSGGVALDLRFGGEISLDQADALYAAAGSMGDDIRASAANPTPKDVSKLFRGLGEAHDIVASGSQSRLGTVEIMVWLHMNQIGAPMSEFSTLLSTTELQTLGDGDGKRKKREVQSGRGDDYDEEVSASNLRLDVRELIRYYFVHAGPLIKPNPAPRRYVKKPAPMKSKPLPRREVMIAASGELKTMADVGRSVREAKRERARSNVFKQESVTTYFRNAGYGDDYSFGPSKKHVGKEARSSASGTNASLNGNNGEATNTDDVVPPKRSYRKGAYEGRKPPDRPPINMRTKAGQAQAKAMLLSLPDDEFTGATQWDLFKTLPKADQEEVCRLRAECMARNDTGPAANGYPEPSDIGQVAESESGLVVKTAEPRMDPDVQDLARAVGQGPPPSAASATTPPSKKGKKKAPQPKNQLTVAVSQTTAKGSVSGPKSVCAASSESGSDAQRGRVLSKEDDDAAETVALLKKEVLDRNVPSGRLMLSSMLGSDAATVRDAGCLDLSDAESDTSTRALIPAHGVNSNIVPAYVARGGKVVASYVKQSAMLTQAMARAVNILSSADNDAITVTLGDSGGQDAAGVEMVTIVDNVSPQDCFSFFEDHPQAAQADHVPSAQLDRRRWLYEAEPDPMVVVGRFPGDDDEDVQLRRHWHNEGYGHEGVFIARRVGAVPLYEGDVLVDVGIGDPIFVPGGGGGGGGATPNPSSAGGSSGDGGPPGGAGRGQALPFGDGGIINAVPGRRIVNGVLGRRAPREPSAGSEPSDDSDGDDSDAPGFREQVVAPGNVAGRVVNWLNVGGAPDPHAPLPPVYDVERAEGVVIEQTPETMQLIAKRDVPEDFVEPQLPGHIMVSRFSWAWVLGAVILIGIIVALGALALKHTNVVYWDVLLGAVVLIAPVIFIISRTTKHRVYAGVRDIPAYGLVRGFAEGGHAGTHNVLITVDCPRHIQAFLAGGPLDMREHDRWRAYAFTMGASGNVKLQWVILALIIAAGGVAAALRGYYSGICLSLSVCLWYFYSTKGEDSWFSDPHEMTSGPAFWYKSDFKVTRYFTKRAFPEGVRDVPTKATDIRNRLTRAQDPLSSAEMVRYHIQTIDLKGPGLLSSSNGTYGYWECHWADHNGLDAAVKRASKPTKTGSQGASAMSMVRLNQETRVNVCPESSAAITGQYVVVGVLQKYELTHRLQRGDLN